MYDIYIYSGGGEESGNILVHQAHDQKVASLNPGRRAGKFFSPKLTFSADSYSVSVPPRVTAVARKRPWSLCQKCRWQIIPKHTYTFDPMKLEWVDYAVQV